MATLPSAPTSTSAPRVDTNFGKFSQGSTVLLTALAFLFNLPVLVLIATIIMAWSAISPSTSPYRLLYQGVVIPLGLLKPRVVEDDPAPIVLLRASVRCSSCSQVSFSS
ncbi:hypothetical protein KSB_71020 [Ktedonobacter robiniae]|uniref:DUF4395 domain-containing protein n=1 Tax=Ktedonobacter robiniae TaxID=2778365 RepID=A0ABQ3V104_9CHLR|nr:hypothetical protein KSB_71020 [Ktedonobacter robiniae]